MEGKLTNRQKKVTVGKELAAKQLAAAHKKEAPHTERFHVERKEMGG